MGNDVSSTAHRRKPSVHSGALYKPASPDFDFDQLSELKETLPDDLKIYSNSIEVLYTFWLCEIEILQPQQFKELAVLFYMNAFQLLPEARPLFNKNIELQAQQFLGMFRWLITNLRQPAAQRILSKMRLLGALHAKLQVKPEWYMLFLQAFHETMSETMKHKYTARVRFCMEQLYTVVMNMMLNRDFESLSSAKIANLLKSLNKLEDCLNDEEATVYLELYMTQQFCVELILFYQDCRAFRRSVSDTERQKRGHAIISKYIEENAECEINVSYDAKAAIHQCLQENENMFQLTIFDACIRECKELMEQNVWTGFKRSIMRMAVDADINYDSSQSTLTTSEATPTSISISKF